MFSIIDRTNLMMPNPETTTVTTIASAGVAKVTLNPILKLAVPGQVNVKPFSLKPGMSLVIDYSSNPLANRISKWSRSRRCQSPTRSRQISRILISREPKSPRFCRRNPREAIFGINFRGGQHPQRRVFRSQHLVFPATRLARIKVFSATPDRRRAISTPDKTRWWCRISALFSNRRGERRGVRPL